MRQTSVQVRVFQVQEALTQQLIRAEIRWLFLSVRFSSRLILVHMRIRILIALNQWVQLHQAQPRVILQLQQLGVLILECLLYVVRLITSCQKRWVKNACERTPLLIQELNRVFRIDSCQVNHRANTFVSDNFDLVLDRVGRFVLIPFINQIIAVSCLIQKLTRPLVN